MLAQQNTFPIVFCGKRVKLKPHQSQHHPFYWTKLWTVLYTVVTWSLKTTHYWWRWTSSMWWSLNFLFFWGGGQNLIFANKTSLFHTNYVTLVVAKNVWSWTNAIPYVGNIGVGKRQTEQLLQTLTNNAHTSWRFSTHAVTNLSHH